VSCLNRSARVRTSVWSNALKAGFLTLSCVLFQPAGGLVSFGVPGGLLVMGRDLRVTSGHGRVRCCQRGPSASAGGSGLSLRWQALATRLGESPALNDHLGGHGFGVSPKSFELRSSERATSDTELRASKDERRSSEHQPALRSSRTNLNWSQPSGGGPLRLVRVVMAASNPVVFGRLVGHQRTSGVWVTFGALFGGSRTAPKHRARGRPALALRSRRDVDLAARRGQPRHSSERQGRPRCVFA